MSERQSPSRPTEFSASALDTWLAGLPIGSTRQYCPLLYSGLQALNEADIDPVLRFAALERLKPIVVAETEKLIALVSADRLVPDTKLRKLAKLSAQFHLELACGYQRVAKHAEFTTALSVENQARTLFVSALSLETYQLRLALIYETTGGSFWHLLGEIFSIAEHSGLLTHQVANTAPRPAKGRLVEVVTRILLFHIVSPKRLENREIRRVFSVIHEFGHLAVLTRDAEEPDIDFVLELEGSGLHVAYSNHTIQRGPAYRYLNTRSFRAKIDSICHPTVPERDRFPTYLGLGMRIRLGDLPPLPPEQRSRDAVLLVGMGSLIDVVVRLLAKGPENMKWSRLADFELLPLCDHGGAQVLVDASKSIGGLASAAFPTGVPAIPSEIGTRQAAISGEFHCHVYQSEVSGYYLLGARETSLASGSLVGINTDDEILQIGVIYGGKNSGRQSLMGFELIGTNPRIASFFQLSAPEIQHKALWFPEKAFGSSLKNSILTGPLRLRIGENLQFAMNDGGLETYAVSRCLELSTFSRYELVKALPTMPHH